MSFLGMVSGSTMSRQKTVTSADPTTPQPTFSNVVWLFGFEGTDGQTTFTDESSRSATISRTADAQIDTSQYKFGSSSCQWPTGGSSARVTENDNAALELGSSDFSMETWIRYANLPGATNGRSIMCCWHGTNDRSWVWHWDDTNGMEFIYSTTGTAIANTFSSAWSPVIDTWYHIAVCRAGANLRMFVDGAQIGATHNISTDTIYNATRQKHIGFSNTSNHFMYGWMDELRWVIGEGIYTTDFAVPTAAHPRS